MIQKDLLLALRANDAAELKATPGCIGKGQHYVRGVDTLELLQDRSRRMTELCACRPVLQRLP